MTLHLLMVLLYEYTLRTSCPDRIGEMHLHGELCASIASSAVSTSKTPGNIIKPPFIHLHFFMVQTPSLAISTRYPKDKHQ